MTFRALATLVVAAAACSAPARLPDLAAAEGHERRGENDQALRAYERAKVSCRSIGNTRRKKQSCATAYLSHAELLVIMERKLEAAQAYEAIPRALSNDSAPSAQATFKAGRIYLELGDDERAYALLWKTVTDYPGEAFAGDALRIVVRDGRARNAKQLFQVLEQLLERFADSAIGDNLLYHLAQLAEDEFRALEPAREYYDSLIASHPKSGLIDEALWHGARLSRTLGDGKGASRRLRKLLSTREVAFGAGSYFSVWLDNAQLELGRVLRDDLADFPAAIDEFRRLPEDYPASILQDDAVFEEAITWHKAGKPTKACKALAKLKKKWPESKFELEQAPELRRVMACGGAKL
jgi:tetratricopeptide (TPR) repeat protein